MKEQLLRWYKSKSGASHRLAVFIMTFFMLRFIDLKAVRKTRASLKSEHPIRLYWDILFCHVVFGFDPSTYAECDFIGKSWKERFTFLSSTEQILFSRAINLEAEISLLDNKNKTYELFKEHFHREQLLVKNEGDYPAFEEFCKKHTRFFCKPFARALGRGTRIVEIGDLDPRKVFDELVSTGTYILEELIEQCPEMSQFNPSSVNTIRTALINTSRGVEMLFAEIRCGRAGSIVDNGGQGGILIPCDIETGRLCKYGYDGSGRKYTCHPDSKVVFENFQVPRWNEVVALSKELMVKIPGLKYVGWDISLTKDNIVLVEGNSRPMVGGLQGLHQTGFKKELLEILDTDTVSEEFRTKQKEIFQ